MAEYKLLMPKMGESVFEATILHWNKKPGEAIEQDESVLEVATDKVDSDVPCPVKGVVKQLLHEEGDTVEVGKVLAIIETDQPFDQPDLPEEESTPEPDAEADLEPVLESKAPEAEETGEQPPAAEAAEELITKGETIAKPAVPASTNRFYSPLVLNIAQAENIPLSELEKLQGSGKEGRITKEDILAYVKDRKTAPAAAATAASPAPAAHKGVPEKPASTAGRRENEIIVMDRMRKLIAQHMIDSKRTSAHVSSFVEADLTNVFRWREKHKDAFFKREGFKLSYMPVFVEAIVQAITDHPMINVSVDGDKIIVKKDINIGVATALPSGNLIVPVIKKADQKNLTGIAREMNDIVERARKGGLKPDDTQGGTYTISNIGSFGNIIGTPIINQPQVAIMAVGSIVKKPAVLETAEGDVIAIRHMMYLSHTYDHRVVDGMLGGLFVRRVADILEQWDIDREF